MPTSDALKKDTILEVGRGLLFVSLPWFTCKIQGFAPHMMRNEVWFVYIFTFYFPHPCRQDKQIDDLDEDVDALNSRLKQSNKRGARLLGKNKSKWCFCVWVDTRFISHHCTSMSIDIGINTSHTSLVDQRACRLLNLGIFRWLSMSRQCFSRVTEGMTDTAVLQPKTTYVYIWVCAFASISRDHERFVRF